MTPDIELQLQVIIKSLKDNVAPAITKDNELAQQQMQLSLVALQITVEHLPFVHAYLHKDIENNIQLAKKLTNISGCKIWQEKLIKAISVANEALNNAKTGFTQLQQESRILRGIVCEVIKEASEGESALDIHTLVLTESAENLNMGRAWNKANGFEPNPDDVPDLATLFS